MKLYSTIPNTTGVFPNTVSRNVTAPGAGDGTPIRKDIWDDIWGFFQEIMDYAGQTPNNVSELAGASQLHNALQLTFIDGLAGGTYSPAASITLNNGLVIDATGGSAADIVGITATGKGLSSGGIFTGGANGGSGIRVIGGSTTNPGIGVYVEGGSTPAHSGLFGVYSFGGNGQGTDKNGGDGVYGIGGAATGTGKAGAGIAGSGGSGNGPGGIFLGYDGSYSSTYDSQGIIAIGGPGGVGIKAAGGDNPGQNGVQGILANGADALDGNYNGGIGGYFIGGAGFGNGYGGTGVAGNGGAPGAGAKRGIGGRFVGYGGSWSGESDGQGLVAIGGSGSGDALWAITASGVVPAASIDCAIRASTGGAWAAPAIWADSLLGIAVRATTNDGVAVWAEALDTGSPLRLVPQSTPPSTHLSEGCLYFDSDTHTLHYYDGSNWQEVAIV